MSILRSTGCECCNGVVGSRYANRNGLRVSSSAPPATVSAMVMMSASPDSSHAVKTTGLLVLVIIARNECRSEVVGARSDGRAIDMTKSRFGKESANRAVSLTSERRDSLRSPDSRSRV